MKKLLFLTVLTMLFAVNATAEIKSGKCGADITWNYNEDNFTLTLTGSGAMTNFTDKNGAPWRTTTAKFGGRDFFISTLVENVIIEGNITNIGDYAFDECNYLQMLNVQNPDLISSIGTRAFNNCSALKIEQTFENATIGDYAFAGCTSMKDEYGVIYLGKYLVEANTNCVKNVVIKSGTTAILSGAFIGTGVETIQFRDETLTSIGDKAFYGCSNLTTLDIPNTVTTWGKDIFYNCISLPNDGTYQKAGDHVIVKVSNKEKSKYTIENGIKYIADNAFENCTNLKYIKCEGNSSPLLGNNALPTINYTTIVPYGCEHNYSTWKNVNTTKMTLNKNKLTTCTFLHNAIIPNDIAVYRAETEDNDINLYKINPGEKSCIVPAGVGIILKAYSEGGEITFTNAGETNIDFETKYGSNKLKGCLEDTPLDKGDNAYGLATIDGVQKFLFIDIATTMPVGKAYLDGTGINTNSARILYEGLTEEDMETDIDEVNASETSSNTRNAIYNLAGQKLTHAQNGLNIVNGKIVIK